MKVNPQSISELVSAFINQFPEKAKYLKEDSEAILKQFINFALEKSAIVTQEEFETYVKVLEKSRAKLETLEKKVAELQQNTPHGKEGS